MQKAALNVAITEKKKKNKLDKSYIYGAFSDNDTPDKWWWDTIDRK